MDTPAEDKVFADVVLLLEPELVVGLWPTAVLKAAMKDEDW